MSDTSAPDAAETTLRSNLLAYLMLALVALLWAANTNIARATADEVPPMALTFWRLLISALVFTPFALRNTWRRRSVVMQHFWLLNGLALLSMAAFNGLVYMGMQYTVAINGNLLQGALPICILLSGILFARRRVTLRQGIGVALGMLGLMTIVIRGDVGLLMQMRINPGDPLVFLGVFGSATYAVFLYRRPAELDLMSFMFLTMVFATFQILPFFIVEHFWFRPINDREALSQSQSSEAENEPEIFCALVFLFVVTFVPTARATCEMCLRHPWVEESSLMLSRTG